MLINFEYFNQVFVISITHKIVTCLFY